MKNSLRENCKVQTRFLLGPAGSGKTFRCLAEIRELLAQSPDGSPLILIAPKQATFQLERQLLAEEKISGFSRLHIFSFDRLAQFIFKQLNIAPPRLLSDEGRVMVLRALLRRHDQELRLFRASARHTGFARELAATLCELQQNRFTSDRLRSLAENQKLPRELRDKLYDLALLLDKYLAWLVAHKLQDANCLLDLAADAIRGISAEKAAARLQVENLWLDGFAEMTPQELALLTAFVPLCGSATLAFCLETEAETESSWLSIWSSIGKTFQECRTRLAAQPGVKVSVETLRREAGKNRFQPDSALGFLERNWAASGNQFAAESPQLRICACANPEAEAIFAAREVLKFVRAGNRLRDCAVLVRQLGPYHKPLARAFRRYNIPFFLDRRESVAHHPLAELTRNALRTIAYDWDIDDWFAALKAGFLPVNDTEIDSLENLALEFGWRGRKWQAPLSHEAAEKLRQLIFPPFEKLYVTLNSGGQKPDGAQLADALRGLWADLKVEEQLQSWSTGTESHAAMHRTVWEQMNAWLDNVVLAFTGEFLPLRDWLPILEAGLANLTVGVIPPVLDEVLVGSVDRARNPDLKFALILGVNESIFPAAPEAPVILTNTDREALEEQNAGLGVSLRDRISRERYLGYIACTRATGNLTITFSRQSADGAALNPSPFIAQLQQLFPQLSVDEIPPVVDWHEAEHANELIPPLVQSLAPGRIGDECWSPVAKTPALETLSQRISGLREPLENENVSSALAESLYGKTLRSSVSRLEEFAQCPFKFFVVSGLRAEERKHFELDVRERGNFQHILLEEFHKELVREEKRWRDITPAEARERIARIAAAHAQQFRDGLLHETAESRFAARAMTAAIQDFVEVIVTWLHGQYDFDPAVAELGFGRSDDPAGPWQIALDDGHKLALRGRIDRVDLFWDVPGESALAVVTDYKSGGKKLDPLFIENGIQLQLLAYLGTLRRWENTRQVFGAKKIIPVGAFYVNLRGAFDSGDTRTEVLDDLEAKKLAYRHTGRFDAGFVRKLDRRTDVKRGDQFNFALNKDGRLSSKPREWLECKDFDRLLDQIEEQLRTLGNRIFSGVAAVDPYRKGRQTPCEYCDYRAICRIDDWTHEWRVLRAAETKEEA